IRPVLRTQENSCHRHSLQARPWFDQDQRRSNRARAAIDSPIHGVRTYPPPRPPLIHQSRHAHPRQGRRSHLPDLRHSPVHLEGARYLLPEIRRRAVEEGD
ncbi:40S ribosomal protein s16, partial [Phtheirospermum japonicum]